MTDVLNNWFTKLWDFVDQRGIIRRAVLGVSMWLLYVQGIWANEFALKALALGKADIGVAGIMSAITAPATLLVGYTFKNYLDSRGS